MPLAPMAAGLAAESKAVNSDISKPMTQYWTTIRDSFSKNRFFLPLIIGSLGFTVRLIHLNSYVSYPAFDLPLGGHAAYVKIAIKILEGDLLGGNQIFYDNSPIYAYILAAIFKVFGFDFSAVRFIQIVVGSLNCVLIGLITRRYFGLRSAWIAGLVAAVYGPFIFYDGEIIVLSWVICFSLLGILLISTTDLIPNPKDLLIAGICLGAAIMGRPNLILFPVLLSFYFLLVWNKISLGKRMKYYAIFSIGVMLIPAMFTLRNYAVSRQVVFLTPSGGHNFYFGHNKDASPVFDMKFSFMGSIFLKYKEIAENELNKPLTDMEASRYWYRKGIDFIIENPLEEARLIFKKILFFMNDVEVPTYFNYYFNRQYSIVLKHWPISFGTIIPFSVLGILASLRNWRRHTVLYLYVATTLLSVVIFFVISRTRLPAVPILIGFAGFGVSKILDALLHKNWKIFLLSFTVILFVYFVTYQNLVQLNFARSYNHLGVVYWYKNKIPEAERAFRMAMQLQRNFEYPLLNLIHMYEKQGKKEKVDLYRKLHEDWKKQWQQAQ
ncbi:MAG: hypothetical protein DRH17_01845 [Deltaproteobacteria bacterium]|nr:MAG: hypothetical protein DRH17_01845 [Deltaproteobacteria bacterium]